MNYKRIFVEKKDDFNTKRFALIKEIREYLEIENLTNLRYLNVYDLINATDEDCKFIVEEILYDKNTNMIFEDNITTDGWKNYRVELVKGQFNNREDGLEELIKTTLLNEDIRIKNSEIVMFQGINDEELAKIKKYYINPVELKEIGLEDFTYKEEKESNMTTEILNGFNNMTDDELNELKRVKGIGLDIEDLNHCQNYFKTENRDPSITELKLIDTYWSDHCRHTTFMTKLESIEFEEGKYKEIIEGSFNEYLKSRDYVYGETDRPISLMDLGTLNAKEIKKKGLLDDLEESEEVNAASIEIDIKVDGKDEKWLLMFKNETHNHPTEIEPFGGASTCLGGAIRDPLSGRSYVYQAMRITGASNPKQKFEETLQGKLPQRKITTEAMRGYSSYANEIGAAAGYIREIYDEGYVAKRMEVGALVAAAPKENVLRELPAPGDKIILVGGKTGKDGLGGAVGSSQGHTEESLEEGGAEVQKGNPKLERKIVRLFRKKEVTQLIKMCNDFGAGGVSVAIGELADGLLIDLNKVPVKYPGMNGTEIALSESQERMAVVVSAENVELFLDECMNEDLEGTIVAEVTEEKRLIMTFKGENIVDINREFLDTNGIRKNSNVTVKNPEEIDYFRTEPKYISGNTIADKWISNISNMNIACQSGLSEKFDHTVGRGTVLMPYGGKNRITPIEGMVAKIPVLHGETDNVSMMSYGYDPSISKWSTFHGGMYSVVESIAKIVALGGDYKKIRFSFQEYFERIDKDREKWGKPFSALLGAFLINKKLDLPSIGGKDSMSGTFEDINVPPTLIAFAVNHDLAENIISPEFKNVNSKVILVNTPIYNNGIIDIEILKSNYDKIKSLVDNGDVLAASSIKNGGISRSITEMALGNGIGFEFENGIDELFLPLYGSIIIEVEDNAVLDGLNYEVLGKTIEENAIVINDEKIDLNTVIEEYTKPLKEVFSNVNREDVKDIVANEITTDKANIKVEKPRVLIPIFTGTHGEYDMGKSFENVGGEVEYFIFKSYNLESIKESYGKFSEKIKSANILAFPDGMILGDEPEGGGKLVKNILKDNDIKDSIMDLLNNRNGLILGIGEGFKGLLGSGLIPYGEIVEDRELISISSNIENNHISSIEEYKIISNNSPWLKYKEIGEIGLIPFSTNEGRIVIPESLKDSVNIVSQFSSNITGEENGIEGLVSNNGRIFGRLGNSERIENGLYKNISKFEEDNIFKASIDYFKN